MTPREKVIVESVAAARGVSVSDYVRELVIPRALEAADEIVAAHSADVERAE